MGQDKQVKQFPVKIFDNLYIYEYVNSVTKEREEFLALDEVDKMECLMKSKASVRKSKFKFGEKMYYTPSFGDFIISNDKEPFKFDDFYFTEKKSDELFMKFEEEYLNIVSCSEKLKKFINVKYTL